jgi:hypothetical protein
MVGTRFRKLRIAFSAVCGIACVLLIALWVRSYMWRDNDGGSSVLSRTTQVPTLAILDLQNP